MKAYFVYTWSGDHVDYDEDDKKYFLHEVTARKYEIYLEEKKKEEEVESYKRDAEWRKREGHWPVTEQQYNDKIKTPSGVCFEEIEIIEELE